MKKTTLYLMLLLASLSLNAQQTAPIVPIIPKPASISSLPGFFQINQKTSIIMGSTGAQKDISFFSSLLLSLSGQRCEPAPIPTNHSNYIGFRQAAWGPQVSPEKYELLITPDSIIISAQAGKGFFNGMMSLVQIAASNTTKDKNTQTTSVKIPCLKITDEPAFTWRGMHLDVSRHFFDIDFVKKYLDLMALYKMNTFHWHLTDDQGWRIEIKKYPELTKTGAWRSGTMIGKYSDKKYDTLHYGGYYTQQQISEIVDYAAKRQITIVPEIEMPGHSVAAIAAYPFLSCTGKKIEVAKGWGVFDDVYCTKDSTFNFLQDVLTEVMELFPGKYIHIGGDECPKERWKNCKTCQARIKSEGLKDEHELQSYFITRIEKFVNSKGKQIIGWDEILEGGLAPNASVMSWRGTKGGIAAAKQKHPVVMTPGKPCYFDHYQSKNKDAEPLAIGGYNPVDSVYNYAPIPSELSAEENSYILGAQGNVWTEYIVSTNQVEYMAVSRMIALSEAVWTQKKNKNLRDFKTRFETHTAMLDLLHVNYARHFLKSKSK